jgi:hypothetical protein
MLMLATELLPQLHAYLAAPRVRDALGLAPNGWRLAFLAQGEYNINYLLTAEDRGRQVVRVNVGTQIGQAGGAQIAYEAAALRLLGPAGVAPRLHYVDDRLAELPFGLLAMEYLPGHPLRYDDPAQIDMAARTLARLHQTPAPLQGPFIRRRPLRDDLVEARGWLASYLACERAPARLRDLFARLLARAEEAAARDADRFPEPFALVHTDVQAHNFIVDDRPPTTDDRPTTNDRWPANQPSTAGPPWPPASGHLQSAIPNLQCKLVDWERPLIDDPTYDLAHFLLPTTTRWKCGYSFSPAEREHFLSAYCAARSDLDPAELRERLGLRWPFILLRAMSWCAGAWVEYTGDGRAIDNRDTLAKIEEYLRPDELRELFGGWLNQ